MKCEKVRILQLLQKYQDHYQHQYFGQKNIFNFNTLFGAVIDFKFIIF